MRHILICVSGWSKTGKDTACERLVRNHHSIQTGLADPAKRYIMDVYGFTYDQVFGPSESRNAGDPRIPKNVYFQFGAEPCSSLTTSVSGKGKEWHYVDLDEEDVRKSNLSGALAKLGPSTEVGAGFRRYYFQDTNPDFFLSPREVLQEHCEQFNDFHINTWIRKGLELQVELARVRREHNQWSWTFDYQKEKGLVPLSALNRWFSSEQPVVTCFSDFRHIHEFKMAREYDSSERAVVLVRVKRPGIIKPPFDHRSENEQALVRDSAFDFVINNDSSLSDLYSKMDQIVEAAKSPFYKSKTWSDSYVARGHQPELGYLP